MANSDLKDKHYNCNHDVAKKYFGETVSYSHLTTAKSSLDNMSENDGRFNNLNPHEKKSLLDWINVTLDGATRKIAHGKKIKHDTGLPNAYRKRDTTKPQKTDSLQAENLNKEIESIKYLMEYMDNNNKNKLL
jgi:hypothetical protein